MSRHLRERGQRHRFDELDAGTVGQVYKPDLDEFVAYLDSRRVGRPDMYVHNDGSTLTLQWLRENGYSKPMLIQSPAWTGMRLPGPKFTVMDVADTIGHD